MRIRYTVRFTKNVRLINFPPPPFSLPALIKRHRRLPWNHCFPRSRNSGRVERYNLGALVAHKVIITSSEFSAASRPLQLARPPSNERASERTCGVARGCFAPARTRGAAPPVHSDRSNLLAAVAATGESVPKVAVNLSPRGKPGRGKASYHLLSSRPRGPNRRPLPLPFRPLRA